MKKGISCILVFAMIVSLAAMGLQPVTAVDIQEIGALWDDFSAGDGSSFTVTADSRVYIIADSEPAGDLLQTAQLIQRELKAQFPGFCSHLIWGAESYTRTGDVILSLDTASGIGAEGYRLSVTNTAARITASDADGLLYGANNLIKCFRAVGGNTISTFSGADTPDTKERTVQLDVARKYFTVEWICNFIRQMSWMGYNSLSLHFSEDGGFRGDLWDPAYYVEGEFEPENDFTWLCGSHLQSWVKDPYRNDPDAGKYLTTAELVQICEVAKEYHMDIIPSFDSPAHMDYITWKYEQHYKEDNSFSFQYKGTTYYAKDSYPAGSINYTGTTGADAPNKNYTTMEIRDGRSDYTRGKNAKAFVFSIYKDMADFFRVYAGSTKFSVGSDEVNLTPTYAWTYDFFPGYINELNTLLNNEGYTVRMYNDFLRADYVDQFADNIEIMYWDAPDNSYSTTMTVEQLLKDGRTLYNCINTNCYFVLRIHPNYITSTDVSDARSADCTGWTFNHSDEDSIYNEWYPANISEYTDFASRESEDVPANQLGGGYFLLWHDYAAVATQDEVWNGINAEGKWNVIDRMWSNTIKMWNADIDKTVSYDKFAAARDGFGDFPGYCDDCSEETELPAASDPLPATAADHSALAAALGNAMKENNGKYTTASYEAYSAAYQAAVVVHKNLDATQTQVDEAADRLLVATGNLKQLPAKTNITVEVYVNNRLVEAPEYAQASLAYSIVIPVRAGNILEKWDGCDAVQSADGSVTVSGNTEEENIRLKLYYTFTPNVQPLETLLTTEKVEDQGEYSDTSWAAYQSALSKAQALDAQACTDQSQIDIVVRELQAAKAGLVKEVEGAGILRLEKLSSYTSVGKYVGLRLTTAPDVMQIQVDGKTVISYYTDSVIDGQQVRVWIVYFLEEVAGEHTYYIRTETATESVQVTVK